jgi:hypothetical protein
MFQEHDISDDVQNQLPQQTSIDHMITWPPCICKQTTKLIHNANYHFSNSWQEPSTSCKPFKSNDTFQYINGED